MNRIIFVNRYFYPDVSATSQILSDLAFALAEKEHYDVTVITGRQLYENPSANLEDEVIICNVRVIRVWTTKYGRRYLMGRALDYLSFYVAVLFTLFKETKQGTKIIAKTDPPMISVVAAICARLKKATLINWSQDLFPEVAKNLGIIRPQNIIYRLMRKLRNWSLRVARRNVVIGDLMAQELRNNGVSANSIEVIHNWTNGISPIEHTENHLRKEWGFSEKFLVGYSGNLGRGHDVGTILSAIIELADRPDIHFLFIGGGARLEELKQRTAGVTNISFRPYQDRKHLSASLSVPDVHLISLKKELEGFMVPSKLYGVLASNRPVIFVGSEFGEVAKIITNAQCGIVIPQDSKNRLAESILYCSENRSHVRLMGNRGRKQYLDNYAAEIALSQWEHLIEQTSD